MHSIEKEFLERGDGMAHYMMNKLLIFLMSISLLAFGIHFYGNVPTSWIAIVMAIGYVFLGFVAWKNEKKYRHLKR